MSKFILMFFLLILPFIAIFFSRVFFPYPAKTPVPRILIFGYVGMLLFITRLGSSFLNQYIHFPIQYANITRLLVHLSIVTIFFLFLLARNIIYRRNFILFSTLFFALGWMAMSMIVQTSDQPIFPMNLARVLLLFLEITIVFLVIPSFGETIETIELLSRDALLFIGGLLISSVIFFAIFGGTESWSVRIGTTINSRIISEMLVIGVLIVTFIIKNRFLAVSFFFGIVATGSRLSMAFVFGLFLFFKLKNIVVQIFILLTVASLWVYIDDNHLQNIKLSEEEKLIRVFKRSNVSSGRLQSWRKAISDLDTFWFWGKGSRYFVGSLKGSRGEIALRLHNGFLESWLSYGFFFFLSSVFFYFYLLFRSWRAYRRSLPYGDFAFFLSLYLIFECFLGTAFWSNLGDPFTLLAFIFFSFLGKIH